MCEEDGTVSRPMLKPHVGIAMTAGHIASQWILYHQSILPYLVRIGPLRVPYALYIHKIC